MCLVVVILKNQSFYRLTKLRRKGSNLRPLGYEPSELPTATTPLCYPYAKLKAARVIFRTKKRRYPRGQRRFDEIIEKESISYNSFLIGMKLERALVVIVSAPFSLSCASSVFSLNENVPGNE